MEDAVSKEPAGKKGGFWTTWFGPITPENVEKEIRQVALAWYVVAGIQFAISIFLVYLGRFPFDDLLDPIVLAIGGYFIQSRKSRAVAIVIFAVSLLELAVTIAAKVGMTDGGKNIWLAVIVVLLGWRGIVATRLFQKLRNARVRWKRVLLISSALTGIGILLAIASAVVLAATVSQPTDDMYGWAVIVPALAIGVVGLALVTAKYPMADLDRPSIDI